MPDFTWGGIGQTLKSAFMGDVAYDPESKKLEQAKSDQERQLAMQSRGDQAALGQALRNQMAGNGPSVAQNQMQTGREQMMRAATSASAGARGSGVAAANKQGMTTAQNIGAGVNRDAASMRAQEIQAATKMATDQAYQQRMQDLQSRGMSIDEAKAQLDYYGKLQATKMQGALAEQKGAFMGVGAVGSLASGISDERAKTNVKPLAAALAGNMDQQVGTPDTNSPQLQQVDIGNPTDQIRREPTEKNNPSNKKADPFAGWGTEAGAMQGYASIGKAISDVGAKKLMPMPEPPQVRPAPAKTQMITTQPGFFTSMSPEQRDTIAASGGLSDEASKEQIKALANENAALRAALKGGSEGAVKGGAAGGSSKKAKSQFSMMTDAPAQAEAQPQFVNESESKRFGKAGYPEEVRKTLPAKLEYPKNVGRTNPNDPWEYSYLDESSGKVVTGRRNPYPGSVAVGTPGRPASDIPDFTFPRRVYGPGGLKFGSEPPRREVAQPYESEQPPVKPPSDEKTKSLKTALAKNHPVSENLSELTPISFKYANNETGNWQDVYGDKTRVGMSANQMEKNPVTHALIEKDEQGLRHVDPAQASLTAMAGTVDLSKRVKELEAQLASMNGSKGKPTSDEKAKTAVKPMTSDVDEAYPAQKSALGTSLKKKSVGSTTQPVVYEEGFTPPAQGAMKRGLVPYGATPNAIERQRAVDLEYQSNQGEDRPSMRGELSGIEGQIAKEGTEQYSGLPTRFYGEQRGKTPVEYKFGMPAPVYQVESPSGAQLKAPKIQSDEEAKLYHEEQKSNAAHALRQALSAKKDPQKVRNLVRAFDKRARGWYETSQPSNPKLIQQQLESRGVKMSTKQIADALREETDL